MTGAFCPGHITCFFHPVRAGTPRETGSRGAGLRLSSGTRVFVEERSDSRVNVTIDGCESEARVSRELLSGLCPGTGFDITVENDLPVGQGFGMSASGAIALALSLCEITGRDPSEAFLHAHAAEIAGGGGLGDVAAISCCGHQPVRVRAGMPPYGEVIDTGIRFDRLTLVVTGTKLNTGSVINDPGTSRRLCEVGSSMVDSYVEDPSAERLFELSRRFSSSVGLESEDVKRALDAIAPHGPAGMCMLGHSIFTTLSEDEVKEILGEDAMTFAASTSDAPPFTRKA